MAPQLPYVVDLLLELDWTEVMRRKLLLSFFCFNLLIGSRVLYVSIVSRPRWCCIITYITNCIIAIGMSLIVSLV
jgi:hypothetical protein